MKRIGFGTEQVLFLTTLHDLSATQMRVDPCSSSHRRLITHPTAIPMSSHRAISRAANITMIQTVGTFYHGLSS